MRKNTVLFLFLTISLLANAQKFQIKGKLHDSQGGELPYATVLLLNAKDSTMVNYALSDTKGDFIIKDVPRNNYLLKVTFIGYFAKTFEITPPASVILDLGIIRMQEESQLLKEVMVKEERIPMKVKNDTLEYDVLAFKPKANEVVEDLIKRMPGIEVATDGSITAQGEQVKRVTVDGKEFFGRDPKMATQNLPADAIAKVQVFDQKSEKAQFTGIDDGQKERTMNLELKDDRKEGAFGNSSIGYGPDNRFSGRTNLNFFDKKGQISILGMGNNLNQQGFSVSDYMNFSGGTQNLMSGEGRFNFNNTGGVPINFDGGSSSNGITTSWAGGLNINRKLSPKTEINGSYFYSQLDNVMNQYLERENFLPSGNYNLNQTTDQEKNNYNHRVNLRLDHKFNDNSSILFTTSSSLSKSSSMLNGTSQTKTSEGVLQNKSYQDYNTDADNLNLDMSLLWKQRLGKPGRTLTVGADFSYTGSNQDALLNANNEFFGETPYQTILNQLSSQTNLNTTISGNATYTEPLGNKRFLEANYSMTQKENEIEQKGFDIDEGVETPNDQLTNSYNNSYMYHRGGLNFLVNRDNYNLTLGSGVQASSLEGTSISLTKPLIKNYLNILPVARFNYQFNNFVRLMANYETSVQEPGILQLQPIIDNRDPLNIYIGNPELRPSYRHRLTLRFNSFNPATSFGFFTFASADYVNDAITNAVSVDESLIQTISPVNTDNNLNVRGQINVTFALNKLKSRIHVGTGISHSQNTNILNDVNQRISNNTLSGNLRYNFSPFDNWETNLSASLNRNLTDYEFSTTQQAYLNQTYSAESNLTFFKNYEASINYRYMVYQGKTSDFDQKVPLLNASIARRFLKNKSIELKLSAFNLLDKDLGVTQTSNVNYYERTVTNSLGRYFLLTFTYSLNRQLNVLENGHRGGGRMMMFN